MNIWRALPCNDGMGPLNPALTMILELFKGNSNEKALKTEEFVTAQAIDYYCMYVFTPVGKLGYFYSIDSEVVLGRQLKTHVSIEQVVRASLHAQIL